MQFQHGVPLERGCPCLSFVSPSCERLKGGRALPFVSVMATGGRMFFLTFDVCTWEERADLRLVCLFLWFFQSQTFQHW